jgi:hypothetical protein
MDDVLARIERWYARQCDGSWEHQFGIRIESLDNPGWEVLIDVGATRVGGPAFVERDVDRGDDDWLRCCVRNGKFEGRGGVGNLQELLLAFVEWAE